jgi:hypothetical protein
MKVYQGDSSATPALMSTIRRIALATEQAVFEQAPNNVVCNLCFRVRDSFDISSDQGALLGID